MLFIKKDYEEIQNGMIATMKYCSVFFLLLKNTSAFCSL